MTGHDTAILRFAQRWRRSRRAGHAVVDGAALNGCGPERLGMLDFHVRRLFDRKFQLVEYM